MTILGRQRLNRFAYRRVKLRQTGFRHQEVHPRHFLEPIGLP